MDNNSNNSGLYSAVIHSIAAIDVALNQLAEARERLAAELPNLPAPPPKPPAENFTEARLQQAYATQARIEDEIAEVERDRDDAYLTADEAKARLEPLEDMLEHVLRFIDECRAYLGPQAQPNRKARGAATAQGIDATYEVR